MSLTSFSRSRRFFWFWAILSLASATSFVVGLDLLVDVLDEAGDAFEDERGFADLGVQPLELDDQVEVDVHYPSVLGLSVNGPTRIRTWDQPVMSR